MIPGTLSEDEERIVRAVADGPLSSKTLGKQIGPADKEGYPSGNLRFTLARLCKVGFLAKDDDGYRITDTGRVLLTGDTEIPTMGHDVSTALTPDADLLPQLVRLVSRLARPTRLQLDVDGWNITLVVKPVGERDREPLDGHRHKPLSDVGESIVQTIGTGSKTGKELASALDMAAEDKSPTPELRVRIKDLKERGLIDYDGKGYRLTPAALAILELSK